MEEYQPPGEHAKINQFAVRCFRDTGDADYLAARLAMRSRLAGPFLWSAEQAIEKYLKCILMLNRRRTNELSHRIDDALDLIKSSLPFSITLSDEEQKVFDHIARWKGDRYLISSLYLHDVELMHLDCLVWRLRQYCEPLNVLHYNDEPSVEVLLTNIRRIESGVSSATTNGYIRGAHLEKVLADSSHPAHEALVWKNVKYSLDPTAPLTFQDNFQAVNAPLWLNPELVDEASKWMMIPSSTIKAARNLAKQRATEKLENERKKAETLSEQAG